MKKYQFILLGLIVFAMNLSAQTNNTSIPQKLSLTEAIEFAKKNNPGLKNAKLDIEKSNAQVNEVKSIGLPQVSGSVTVNDYIQLPASFIPLSAFNPAAPKDQYQRLQFGTQW